MNKQDRINDMLHKETRMSKWKKPQALDFVYGATSRYSFVNWQTGNDDSIYNKKLDIFNNIKIVNGHIKQKEIENIMKSEDFIFL